MSGYNFGHIITPEGDNCGSCFHYRWCRQNRPASVQDPFRKGHAVRALYRKPEQQALLGELGAEPVSGSLTELDAAALAMHFAGSDTVVFTAGAGGKGAGDDQCGRRRRAEKSVAAALSAGVSRFLLVSAFPESARGETTSESFENYMRVKKWPMWNWHKASLTG